MPTTTNHSTPATGHEGNPPVAPGADAPAFAETALRMSGKSADEVRRTGAVDAADERIEDLFAAEYQTVNSPLHRAVWDRSTPIELFDPPTSGLSAEAERVLHDCLEIVGRHVQSSTLYDPRNKISEGVLDELGEAGYWGLLVGRKYGGSGFSFSEFTAILNRMATLDPTVAGLASVHGCIGAVDPVQTFGTEEQKQRHLPGLARGKRLSAFALTEPCAGTDLTALRTTARAEGSDFVVNGEKLFITNVWPGRTIGLVAMVDQQPAVLVVDLPDAEDECFQLKRYGLYALRHAHNYGIVFRDFRVPGANLLRPARGDGLTIAYHGLNRGRISLCATAAGAMRFMLADMIPWAHFRRTYGAPIGKRELVRHRLGRLAGLIVACDALSGWCADLLDRGYRAEMECIVAKIFGSETQHHAAIDLYMKTHGGRAFLHGHFFGDNVHDFLAPCIYEGEGEMLGLALFKSLVKHHAREYFEPVGNALEAAGIRRPNLAYPAHLWALKGPLWSYARWYLRRRARLPRRAELPPMPRELRKHAEFAAHWLRQCSLEITGTLRKHQLKLADRQCRMAEISRRVQWATVILATSLFASRSGDELVRQAADCMCDQLTRRLTGGRPTDRWFRKLDEVGAAIADGEFTSITGIAPRGILMSYRT